LQAAEYNSIDIDNLLDLNNREQHVTAKVENQYPINKIQLAVYLALYIALIHMKR